MSVRHLEASMEDETGLHVNENTLKILKDFMIVPLYTLVMKKI